MAAKLSPELYWLTATALLTSVLWIPYILQLIGQMGFVAAFWDPYHETPHDAPWAQRAKRAHTNAVENLAVFAPLALALHVTSAGTALTAAICMIYFLARLAHYIVYVSAVPLVRTILFFIGFLCQVVLASTLLGWIR